MEKVPSFNMLLQDAIRKHWELPSMSDYGINTFLVGLFDILPEFVGQAQICLVNDRIFVCYADLCGDRYQIKVHHVISLKVENMRRKG